MAHGGRAALGAFMAAFLLAAPPKPKPPSPALLPGEVLVISDPDRAVWTFGEAGREGPMGDLACLVWVKLEGDFWSSADLAFKCQGSAGPFRCTNPKGHGRVDTGQALQAGCRLAFLAWASYSFDRWRLDYGEGAARARLEEAFQPFVGPRMPPGTDLPELNMGWFGSGDFLRTSPEAFLRWMADPAQEEAVRMFRRRSLNAFQDIFKKGAWWIIPAVSELPDGTGRTQAWAVGGNELILAVLRLGPGSTAPQALQRFRDVMVQPARK